MQMQTGSWQTLVLQAQGQAPATFNSQVNFKSHQLFLIYSFTITTWNTEDDAEYKKNIRKY